MKRFVTILLFSVALILSSCGEIRCDGPLDEYASAVISDDMPTLVCVENEYIISEYFRIDRNAFDDVYILQCPISSTLTEIILIRDDDVSEAEKVLYERQKKAVENDAFYPDDCDRAESSIVGSYGNIAYFIMCDSSDEAEERLLSALENRIE